MPLIPRPTALEDPAVLIDADAEPMALLLNDLTPVIAVFVTLYGKVWHRFELIKIEQVSQHVVVAKFFLLCLRQHLRRNSFLDRYIVPCLSITHLVGSL